jgi:hypothetical protein
MALCSKTKGNKLSKSIIVETINNIVVGAVDISDNKVISVLAKHNEYVIYEIEADDINSRLKVLIDGHTDESEEKITKRFNNVKQKYIEAKGMLSKSSNFEMMKNRIANTLSTCLNNDDTDGKQEFSDLISTITKEHEELVINRAIYLSPAFLSSVILFVLCLILIELRIENTPYWQILVSLMGASLGGSLSILINAKTLNFEEFKAKKHYFLLGVERILLAFIAGAVAFISLKSGVLSPSILSSSYWSFMLVLVIAGFSESFIPGFLSKTENSMHNKALQRTSR